jgi:hypothetical protein
LENLGGRDPIDVVEDGILGRYPDDGEGGVYSSSTIWVAFSSIKSST